MFHYFSTEKLQSFLLLIKRNKRGTTYIFLIIKKKNKAKMTKWTFAPHRPHHLMSAFSFLYMYIDFLCVCIYRDRKTDDEIWF